LTVLAVYLTGRPHSFSVSIARAFSLASGALRGWSASLRWDDCWDFVGGEALTVGIL
jgi:hypothetical protein